MVDATARAEEYRRRATELRFLAQETQSSEGRQSLLALANVFDILADRVESWERLPVAAD